MSTVSYIFLSVLLVSLVSLAGVSFLALNQKVLNKLLLYLVGMAVGALFANVFFHLMPEMVEHSHNLQETFGLILLGLLISFVLEKFVHWHHCHTLDCDRHIKPVGTMMLIGDAVHNITDGILIATTYLVDVKLGIATTIAVIMHEIPQEIGDFAVLLHSGYKRGKALMFNFLTALTAFAGAALVLLLHEQVHGIEEILLPIVAGNFLYIAGSDMIPELHKDARAKNAALQLVAILIGIGLIYALTSTSGGHGH